MLKGTTLEVIMSRRTDSIMISVRIKTTNTTKILHLEEGTKIGELKRQISLCLNVDVNNMKILIGFPRKVLDLPEETLISSVLTGSETLIVEQRAETTAFSSIDQQAKSGASSSISRLAEVASSSVAESAASSSMAESAASSSMAQSAASSSMAQNAASSSLTESAACAMVPILQNVVPLLSAYTAEHSSSSSIARHEEPAASSPPFLGAAPRSVSSVDHAYVASEFDVREPLVLCGLPGGVLLQYFMPANNSCLFCGVNFVVTEGECDISSISYLRTIIAEHVAANPHQYTDAILGQSNSDYCEWIKNEQHWGGAIELSILCEYFQVEITVIDRQSKCVHRFGENFNFDKRVFLIYNGSHYDAVAMKYDDTAEIKTIFSSRDCDLLYKAVELSEEQAVVSELGIKNWICACKTCGYLCKTQQDVIGHATDASHYGFTQIEEMHLLQD